MMDAPEEDVPAPDTPADFWEERQVEKQLATFEGAGGARGEQAMQSMPMLVAVRVRPMWQKEMDEGDYSTVRVLEGKVVVVLDPWFDPVLNPNRAKEKKYAFDIVFDEDVQQEEVYDQTARGLVGGVLDGYNSSVFAYGATGAGKTHTMLGSLDAPGVMVNTLHDLFGRMADPAFQEAKFKVTLSYMEIYNELIKDLLQPASVDLKLNEDPVRGMVVQGITEYGADSADEILELLHRGNMHRAVEPTAANQVSSRSHAVLQITVEQSEATAHVTGNVRIGKLSMVDLAGSERASKTDNTGARLKEGANINRSLLALGNCITALADKNRKGHVPFRDSKMTRLLKDSLGGNCRTVMIANISPSHKQFEETINTLKYANRAKNLKTQVARNVLSVSAHIAEYQRVIMELRNEVSDLKSQLKAAPSSPESRISAIPSHVGGGAASKQRSLDYVDNLEKQHMQQLKDAIMSALNDRRRLLNKITDLSKALSEARAKEATENAGADRVGHDAAADASAHSVLHGALADVRRQLQQNQQTVNEIVATAMQRISSTERLQLLQLLVRGKFLEVMNEEMATELTMRRSLSQAAMAKGSLPPELMHDAMSTEAWYTEHRAALDFHAKMASTEMGGSLRAPSIAQLLDQNLVSPQQAASAQNLGELVRPFTNHRDRKKPGSKLHDASRNPEGGEASGALSSKGKSKATAQSAGMLAPHASPLAAASASAPLLGDLVPGDDAADADGRSSTSASDRGSRYGNSASSSLQSSRGPTSQRGRGGAAPPPGALSGLKRLKGGSRQAHSPQSETPSRGSSRPPSLRSGAASGGIKNHSRPPGSSGGHSSTSDGKRDGKHRVRRYQPGAGPDIRNKGRSTPVVHVVGASTSPSVQAPAQGRGIELPPIGTPSAVQLASARAAAAARQPSRVQALGDAYGGGGGGKLPPALRKPTVVGRDTSGSSGSRMRRPSSERIAILGGVPQVAHRKGIALPPAARSQAIAARLNAKGEKASTMDDKFVH